MHHHGANLLRVLLPTVADLAAEEASMGSRYADGYHDAVEDVRAALRDGNPRDSRGWWATARKRALAVPESPPRWATCRCGNRCPPEEVLCARCRIIERKGLGR